LQTEDEWRVVLAALCRLSNGKAAEAELKGLAEACGGKHTEHDLIRHNLVVFRGGEGAMQVRQRQQVCQQMCPDQQQQQLAA
jgi:hypothetical protein